MAPQQSGPAAVNDEADCCAGNTLLYSGKRSKNQSASQAVIYQRVSGDLGPIGLIGSPRVVVETHATKAFVWIENKPWGWPELRREFLNPQSPKVARYAKSLALMIQAAALKEQDRKAKRDGARWQERIDRAVERRGE